MKESSLGNSLIDSIGGTVADSMGNILEIGLDSIMEEGLLKDVPFISTAISVFKIGKSIFDRHNIKKLAIFIDEINKKTIDEKKVQQYKEKIQSDAKKSEQELEYLLVILARYIGYEKPAMLAKIYLAYLDKKITWNDLALLSEVVDRLLPGDYNELASAQMFTTKDGAGDHIMLRLEALGLIIEEKQSGAFVRTEEGGLAITAESMSNYKLDKSERTYVHTDLGTALVSILGWRPQKQ